MTEKKITGDRLDDAAIIILAAINRKDERVVDLLYFLASIAGYRLIPDTAEALIKGKD
jgi:hypothetical protein